MEPEIVPPRDVRQVSKRIDRAGHDRAGRTDQRDSGQTSFAVTRDRSLQCRNVDPHVIVDRDQAQVRASNTEHRNRLRNRHVDLFGGVDHARLRTIFVRRSARLARHRERHQVPQRAATREGAGETATADRLGEPSEYAPLDRHRSGCRTPCRDVLVQHRRVEVPQRPDRVAGPQNVREPASCRRPHVLSDRLEIPQDRFADALLGQGQVERSRIDRRSR